MPMINKKRMPQLSAIEEMPMVVETLTHKWSVLLDLIDRGDTGLLLAYKDTIFYYLQGFRDVASYKCSDSYYEVCFLIKIYLELTNVVSLDDIDHGHN